MDIVRLFIPLLGVIFGFVVKNSNKEQFASVKKYWLFFVIAGAFMFLFRKIKVLGCGSIEIILPESSIFFAAVSVIYPIFAPTSIKVSPSRR